MAEHATMKSIRVKQFGGPEVLQVETVEIPVPSAGQVLVKVFSSGINPVETYIRTGTHSLVPKLPWVPGNEGAGEVVKVGEGVDHVKAGDRVWLSGSLTGTYAQYSVSNGANVHLLPKHISYDQGAAIWVAYGTAYHAIYHISRTAPNSTVLVHGASGGVGVAALQLLRRLPGTVILGTAGTDAGLKLLKENGAKGVYNHKNEGYINEIQKSNETGVDVILEMIANVNLVKDFSLLARNGRVAVIGNRGPIEINARDLMGKRSSVHGVALQLITPEERTEIINEIEKGILDPSPLGLNPIVGKGYKLTEAPQAHHDIINPPKEDGGKSGKIVVHPWEE